MKRLILFYIITLLFGMSLHAQEAPDWIDSDVREFLYPKEKYLVGYAEQMVKNKKLLPFVTDQTRTQAQTNLMEGIYLQIKSNTTSQIETTSVNGNYLESESYNSNSTKSSMANINGMQVQTFYNKKNNYVYAFAYVSISNLSTYYNNSLVDDLKKLKSLILLAKSLKNQNDFKTARTKCTSAKDVIVNIENTQNLLLSLNDVVYANNDSLKYEVESARKELSSLDAQLDVKYEIIYNLENKIDVNIKNIEALIKLANQLLSQSENNSAKTKCEEGMLLIEEIKEFQKSLIEVEPKISIEQLHKSKVDALERELSRMISELSQSNKVYIESAEDLFGKSVNVINNKLKAELAKLNCSFVDNEDIADYKIVIESEVRESSNTNNLVFCFADVSVTVFDLRKDKEIYSDFITIKGGSSSKEKAGHKAMQSSVSQIVENISEYIK